MQSSLLLNVDSTTTLFSLRTRQLKAEPLNNMLRNVFWSPGSSKWDAFFHSTTLFVVTMNCPSQIMILLKTEHKFLNLQLVKCIIVMYCVTSRDYASQLHITGLKCWVEHMAAFESVIYLFPGSLPLLVHFIWRRGNRVPSDGFHLNTLKALFSLPRVLLDLKECILRCAIKFVSVRSS